jgi:hypothetical protein
MPPATGARSQLNSLPSSSLAMQLSKLLLQGATRKLELLVDVTKLKLGNEGFGASLGRVLGINFYVVIAEIAAPSHP